MLARNLKIALLIRFYCRLYSDDGVVAVVGKTCSEKRMKIVDKKENRVLFARTKCLFVLLLERRKQVVIKT